MKARSLFFLPFVFLAAACSGGEPAGESPGTSEAPVDGGTAVISTVSDFDAFNELVSTDYDTNQTMSYILFANLVQLDEEMNYEPYLADSFWMSEDGRRVNRTRSTRSSPCGRDSQSLRRASTWPRTCGSTRARRATTPPSSTG